MVLTTLIYSGVADAKDVWKRARDVVGADATADSVVVVDSELCFSASRRVRLTCLDQKLQARFRLDDKTPAPAAWRAKGLFLDRTLLVQAYVAGNRMLIRRVDRSGKLVGRHELRFAPDAKPEVLWVATRGTRGIVAYRMKRGVSKETVAVVDLARAKVLRQVPARLFPLVLRHGRLAIGGTRTPNGRPGIVAYDIASGRLRWTYHGVKGTRFGPPGAFKSRIHVTNDRGVLFELSASSGRAIRSVRLTRRRHLANVRPTVHRGKLYALLDKLYRLNLKRLSIERRQHTDKAWGRIAFAGDTLMIGGYRHLELFDRRSLAPVARFLNKERWTFKRPILGWGADTFVVIDRFDRNQDYTIEMQLYRRAQSGRLELAVPRGVAVYRDGQMLGSETTTLHVAAGRYILDLLQAGCIPRQVRVRVPAAGTARVEEIPPCSAAASVPALAWGRLPAGASLRKFFTTRPHGVHFHKSLHGSREVAVGGNIIFGVGQRSGLLAYDHVAKRLLWQRSAAELAAELPPPAPTRRRPDYYLAAVAPDLGLVVIATGGYISNWIAAFDQKTGQRRWRTQFKTSLLVFDSSQTGFARFDGMLWGKLPHEIYALDLRTGRRVFARVTGGDDDMPRGQLYVAKGRLYYFTYNVTSRDARLVALKLYTQRELWSKRLTGPHRFIADSDGKRLFLLGLRVVRSVSLDGRMVNRRLRGKTGEITPVLSKDNIYVCGHAVNQFYALRKRDLRLLWTFRPPRGLSDPCPSWATRTEIAARADRFHRLLISAVDGKVIESRPIGRQERWPTASGTYRAGRELCFFNSRGADCFPLR